MSKGRQSPLENPEMAYFASERDTEGKLFDTPTKPEDIISFYPILKIEIPTTEAEKEEKEEKEEKKEKGENEIEIDFSKLEIIPDLEAVPGKKKPANRKKSDKLNDFDAI